MKDDGRALVRQCLLCVDSRSRGLVLRPPADKMHGTAAGEVVDFDFQHLGGSEVARGNDEMDGYTYVLLPLEDISGCI